MKQDSLYEINSPSIKISVVILDHGMLNLLGREFAKKSETQGLTTSENLSIIK